MIAFIVWIVLTMGKVMAQGNKSRAEESNFKWPRWLKISYHVPRSKDGLGGL
jgi:hypothetical protein